MAFSNKNFAAVLLLVTVTGGSAIASPEFLTYEGRNAVHDGQGGERKTIDGVDFWMRGDLPRRYQVIGSLTDERHKTGLYGLIRMSSLESDIAKAAKAAGGDAVILQGEGDEVIGAVGSSFGNVNGDYGNGSYNSSGSLFGYSTAVKNHDSRYLVVKYLPDPPPSGATQVPSAPPPPQSQSAQ